MRAGSAESGICSVRAFVEGHGNTRRTRPNSPWAAVPPTASALRKGGRDARGRNSTRSCVRTEFFLEGSVLRRWAATFPAVVFAVRSRNSPRLPGTLRTGQRGAGATTVVVEFGVASRGRRPPGVRRHSADRGAAIHTPHRRSAGGLPHRPKIVQRRILPAPRTPRWRDG